MLSDFPKDHNVDLPSHEVTEAAKARLQKSPYLRIRNLSCEYDQGVLVLGGRLPSFYLKQLAQVAVAGLEGVMHVVNDVDVVQG